MKLSQGDMWSVYDQADLFLVTTNGVVSKDDKLVMGAGIAKQARDRFPGLDKALGKAVLRLCTKSLQKVIKMQFVKFIYICQFLKTSQTLAVTAKLA